MNTSANVHASQSAFPATVAGAKPGWEKMRGAVRFPLALPVMLSSGEKEYAAVTRNISASGVLLQLDHRLDPGQDIRFSLTMPAAALGTPHDILVHCAGRVVRCCISNNQLFAASTIDDYRFAEQ